MIHLDMQTTHLSYIMSAIICVAVMTSLWLSNRKRSAGLGFWLIDSVLQFIAIVLLVLRGTVPVSISILLARPLAVAGTFLLYQGLERYTGKKTSQRYNYFLLTGYAVIHLYFMVVQPSSRAITINFSLALLAILIQCSWLMLTQVDSKIRPGMRLVGVTFVTFSLFNVGRVVSYLRVLPGANIFTSSPTDVLLLMFYQMLYVVLCFSLFLMVNHGLVEVLELDITERKRAQNAVRESEVRHRTLVENIPQRIFMKSRDYRFVTVNESFARNFGIHPEEMVGKVDHDLFPKELADKYRADDERIMETGVTDEFDEEYKEGKERRIVHMIKTPIRDQSGAVTGLLGVFWDVTERKRAEAALRESEQRYHDFIEHSNEGVWRVEFEQPIPTDLPAEEMLERASQSGYLAECNQAFARDLGFSAPQEIVGKTLRDLFPLSDQGRWESFRSMARGGLTGRTVETQGLDRSGNLRYGRRTEVPIIQNGKLLRVWGITSDITERKRAEAELANGLRFETMLAELSARFVHLPAEQIDGEIKDAQRRVCESLALDGCSLWQVMAGTPGFIPLTHIYRQSEGAPIPEGINAWHYFPWSTQQTLAGKVTVISTLDELPTEAARDRQTFDIFGIKSVLTLGLSAGGGPVVGGLAFNTRTARTWPEELVKRLHVVAGLFCSALERQRSERALRESEERFRSLVENATVGIYRTTPQGSILMANPTLCRMLGYKDLAELGARDLEGEGFEPGYPRQAFRERIERDGEVIGLESAWARKDGSIIFVRESARAIRSATGEIPYYDGIVEDVTERKRAEAERVRLVTAIEQSAEAVVITNTAGEIEYVNPAFTHISGYSREEALGQNPRLLKSGKQGPALYQELWATISQGNTWKGEVINRRKDGSLYTEQMVITPVRDELGKVTHFIAVKQDVTERKHLEEQFRQAQKMQAVGRLAGGVAHDFNNLLTIINGYSEMALDRMDSSDPISGLIAEIGKAGERAASLTRQLLAFSRQQVLAPRVLDLNALVAEVQKMLRRLIGEDIELTTVQGPALGRVKADPGQIEQILMNLAVNARDAMPRGGKLLIETADIELDDAYARTRGVVTPGHYVMLAVGDTGIGMDAETQAHIFEPFFTTKEKGKGTGLGLATVYGIVKQSGGYVWVYSEPGKGTTFKIYLPRVDGADELAQAPEARGHAHTGSETILLVEDEEAVRTLASKILRELGYKVLESANPESALEISERYNEPIHLLLTDVVMPGMSGRKVAEGLTFLRPKTKVVYMSGYTDDSVVRHGVLETGTAFLQKPFTPAGLARKIREVLDAGREASS